ncbi:atypical chemokine receptor 2 [Silurus meridionalis]|uniref:atypical chemokine receptor 2 n=1 Tax=Silurus meridionalis TaxID=175797 RepID=UPI001EEA5527|nr:atypical chemokine receptor 2 [Silurus meridionalis]
MDVSDHIEESDLARVNESDYDYSDYYLLEELADFWPCEKHHVRKISRYLLPVFYSVACALGFLANLGLVLVCTRRTSTRMRLRMAVHPACALCANLLFTSTLPFWAVYAARDWIFGARACKAVTLVYAVGLYGGNLFGACALLRSCVDAACALRCTGRLGNARRNAAWCACVWTLACLAAVPHLSFVEESHFHGETHCSYHYTQGWKVYMRLQLVLLVFLVPFLIFLGSSIALFLRTRSSGCSSRMLRRAIISTGLFFALWFPYALVLMLHVLQDLHIVSECGSSVHLDLAIQSTECIAFSHVFINPVAYLLLNRRAWRTFWAKCVSSREYLLDSSENTDSVSSQDSGVELRALQNFQSFSNPENERGTAEKQCHLLPYAT